MVSVIDIGLGNISSILNMLKKVGAGSCRAETPGSISEDTRLIILPGVGSFDYAMKKLNHTGWSSFLKEEVQPGRCYLMGICLGMQLLCDGSEEGELPGLGLIPGTFRHFSSDAANSELKVPHMGWNHVEFHQQSSWMGAGIGVNHRYYFVHSYYYSAEQSDHIAGITYYGVPFASAIEKEKIFGFQFHPEKSHKFGMQLFRNVIKRTDA